MDLELKLQQGIKILLMKSENSEEYYVIGKSFITDLLNGMGKLSIKYHKHQLIDFPYIYGERQLDSIILPTLSKICDGAVLAELPTKRNCFLKSHEIEDSSGRIDYWCIYKDYSIILEVKHSFDAFLTNKTREKKVVEKWEYMTIDQLQSIKDDIKQQCEENTKGIIRLGLHFITSYSDKQPSITIINKYGKLLPTILERIKSDVCRCKPTLTNPDYMACWIIPKQIVLEGFQTFPGLILMGKIFKPILHKKIIK